MLSPWSQCHGTTGKEHRPFRTSFMKLCFSCFICKSLEFFLWKNEKEKYLTSGHKHSNCYSCLLLAAYGLLSDVLKTLLFLNFPSEQLCNLMDRETILLSKNWELEEAKALLSSPGLCRAWAHWEHPYHCAHVSLVMAACFWRSMCVLSSHTRLCKQQPHLTGSSEGQCRSWYSYLHLQVGKTSFQESCNLPKVTQHE